MTKTTGFKQIFISALLGLSLLANLVLFAMFLAETALLKANNHIIQTREHDTKALTTLLVGKLDLENAKRQLSPVDGYFFKESENAIGLGGLTLYFDKLDKLENIEVHTFEGP